eukprot:GFUD01045793.1.p1 GENE.GFUD01045793.1~~GFUD01045793.1.p1  ORF type:complete len:326 (-),score=56.87 GFUD01045793.1:19-996(-)
MAALEDYVFVSVEDYWRENAENKDKKDAEIFIKEECVEVDIKTNNSDESEKDESIVRFEERSVNNTSIVENPKSMESANNQTKKIDRNVIPKLSAEDELAMNSMMKVDDGGIYLCNSIDCEYKSKTKNGLKRHIKVMHLNLVSYNCKQCDYATKFSQSLNAHVLGVHDKIDHFCKFCDFKSTHKTTIYQHIKRVHENKEKQKCPDCDYQSASNHQMRCHINGMHVKIPLFCNQCKFETTWENCLRNHVRSVHEKEKRHFSCDFCEFTSVFPYAMKTHIYFTHQSGSELVLTKNDDGKFSCDHCEFTSIKVKNLKQHIVSKHVSLS